MPRIAARLFSAVTVVLIVSSVHAQVGSSLAGGPSRNSAPQKPQPYTAEFKITRVQTLADGTTITNEGTEIRARDSAGITMQSNTNENWQIGRVLGTSAGVHDTDGTILANWFSLDKTARVFKMPPMQQRHGCWMTASNNMRMDWNDAPRAEPNKLVFNPVTRAPEQVPPPVQRSRPQIVDLGTMMIQGVQARGRRITRTISVGEVGNDQTIVAVEEYWMAPILGLKLREIIEDPRTGKRTRELVSVTLDEPDPSLFQPPPDYQVTTEELHQVACPNDR
ncbi:MAG TPA: hypothetical protein VG225_00875 [Terracidiphilus sp.]|jgi:hypothetical protein|nr:hypothetical protein [Terracidiphilus sp.]